MINNSSSEMETGYSEAIATWSVRYLEPSAGFECVLSIQDETGADVLKKAEKAIEYLVEAKCLPLHKENQNGYLSNNGKATEPTVLVKSDNGKNPICPIHNVEMQKWSKNGRSWYAHRLENGYWCKGQPK